MVVVKQLKRHTNKYNDIRYRCSGSSKAVCRRDTVGKGTTKRQDKEGNDNCDRTTKIKVLSGS